jgi:hypothetical protein
MFLSLYVELFFILRANQCLGNDLDKLFQFHSYVIIIIYGHIYINIFEMEGSKHKVKNLCSSQDIYHTCWSIHCVSPCFNTRLEFVDNEIFILGTTCSNCCAHGRGINVNRNGC